MSRDIRFAAESGHRLLAPACPLWAQEQTFGPESAVESRER
jgi:hypothetical protein